MKNETISKKLDEIASKIKILNVTVSGENISLNIYDELRLTNPENPGEIVHKMNMLSSNLWWLSSAVVEVDTIIASKQHDFDMWFDEQKMEYDGKKNYSSEKSKDRAVIFASEENRKFYDEYARSQAKARKILGKLKSAQDVYERYMTLITSIGSIARAEMGMNHGGYSQKRPLDE